MDLQCSYCGNIFESPYYLRNIKNLRIVGNNTVPCPRCHNTVSIAEGEYDVDKNGVWTLLSDPSIPRQALENLKELVSDEGILALTKEELAAKIEQIDPSLVRFAKFITDAKYAGVRQVIQIIIACIGIVTAVYLSRNKKPSVINNIYNFPPSINAPISDFKRYAPSVPSVDWNQVAPRNTNLTPPKKKRKRGKRGGGL